MNKSYTSRLSSETLSEIFSLCLDHRTPWFLGKICATWRDIVWSTPHLWSSVTIKFSCQKFSSQIESLEEWLARSGSCPLSIHIDAESAALWRKCPPEDVIRVIEPHAIRWRHVILALPLSSLSGLSHRNNQFLLLNSLVIKSLNPPDALPGQYPVDILGSAPQLPNVDLRHPSSPSPIFLPWHHLTSFSGTMTIKNCIDLLPLTPRLVDCTFNVPYNFGAAHYPAPEPSLLSRLVRLVISSRDAGVAVQTLRRVTAPALRELSIIEPGRPNTTHTDSEILAFLGRSVCSLQKLHCKTMIMDGLQLIELLRSESISSLVELHIAILDWSNSMSPTGQLGEQVVLSKLKSFEIQCNAGALGGILDSMTLPAAENIAVEGLGQKSRGFEMNFLVPNKPILGFLARSPSLRRLSITNLVVFADQLGEHLESVPSLVELKVHNIRENTYESGLRRDDVIPLLNLSRPGTILPNLEVFDYRDVTYFDGKVLSSVLASRWRGERWWVRGGGREQRVVRLGAVRIVTERWDDRVPELGGSVMAELQKLTEEGLRFSLTVVRVRRPGHSTHMMCGTLSNDLIG